MRVYKLYQVSLVDHSGPKNDKQQHRQGKGEQIRKDGTISRIQEVIVLDIKHHDQQKECKHEEVTQDVRLHVLLCHHFLNFGKIPISWIKLKKLSSLFVFIYVFCNSILWGVSTTSHHHLLLISNTVLCFLDLSQLPYITHELLIWLSEVIRWSHKLINTLILSFLVRNLFNNLLVSIIILLIFIFVSFVVLLFNSPTWLKLMKAQMTISLDIELWLLIIFRRYFLFLNLFSWVSNHVLICFLDYLIDLIRQ